MRTALVTGAASGIGRATAERLTAEGWRVYAVDTDAARLETLDGCTTVVVDVTDADDVEAIRARIADDAGGLHCLVANAGVAQLGPVVDAPTDSLEAQFAVNVHGVHRTVRTLFPLLDAVGGTAVIVSSTHGRITTPGMGAYAASKHAVETLAETLHMEVAPLDVDVALVEPAWVSTAFAATAANRLADVDRTERFRDVYDAMAEGSLVDGGPLAVPPEAVAQTIRAVAVADEPGLRHPVGWQARLLLATRWLPWRLRSVIQRTAVRTVAGLYRLREAIR